MGLIYFLLYLGVYTFTIQPWTDFRMPDHNHYSQDREAKLKNWDSTKIISPIKATSRQHQ